MALSQTAIVNQALSRIGQGIIQDIDDSSSVTAVKMQNIFEQSVRAMGRMHPWKCLTERSILTPNTETPVFGYAYSYNLPENFIRMISFNDTDSWDQEDLYKREGQYLLTDKNTAKCVYTRYYADSTRYDSLFTEALIVYLAGKASTVIRQDEALGYSLMEEFRKIALPEAKTVDGNEEYRRPRKYTKDSEWVNSRRGVNRLPGGRW